MVHRRKYDTKVRHVKSARGNCWIKTEDSICGVTLCRGWVAPHVSKDRTVFIFKVKKSSLTKRRMKKNVIRHFKTSGATHQKTQRHTPEDLNLQQQRKPGKSHELRLSAWRATYKQGSYRNNAKSYNVCCDSCMPFSTYIRYKRNLSFEETVLDHTPFSSQLSVKT